MSRFLRCSLSAGPGPPGVTPVERAATLRELPSRRRKDGTVPSTPEESVFCLEQKLCASRRTDCPHPFGQASGSDRQAAFSRLRIASIWLALIRPTAMASITASAMVQRVLIFLSPRIVCFSKPKLTSRRLLTRSTAVRRS